ncbi:SRPBCC domain-containing protein [Micromonospora olivasterospora]|uniref:SRPBCC domain-containing protein n=1 Tax=Micromonospora olivasterospora TaxID=1880 RepID=UPI001B8675AE|nr:SRPBCC domain-containing protein [Micromonospora olivasterospora]
MTTTEDGRLCLRLTRRIPVPPETVWPAITEARRLEGWFPSVVSTDFAPGAKLTFDLTAEQREHMGIGPDEDMSAEGEVLRYEAPRHLEYTWGEEIFRWTLDPDGPDGTLLTFVDIFDDRSLAAQMASSWHAVLDLFEARLTGRDVDWSVWDREAELRGEYAEAVP